MVRLAILVVLFGLVSATWAGEYYVSATGDDMGDGSAQSPWRTLGKAAATAGPGDTVKIAPGRYREGIRPGRSGAKDRPITFAGAGDASVIVNAGEKTRGIDLTDRDYIVVEGLFFKDCYQWVQIDGGHHNTFRKCSFSGTVAWAGFKINSSSDNRVLDCTFLSAKPWSDESRSEAQPWIPRNQADYIQIWRDSHRNLVQGCTFGEIGHVAIHITGREKQFTASHNVIRANRFVNPRWKALGIHNTEYTLVEDNLFTGLAANFIQFEGPRVIFRRNRLIGYRDSTNMQPEPRLRAAIRLQSMRDYYKVLCPATGNRIYNNLFYDNQRTLTTNSTSLQTTDNVFVNNIFFRNAQTIYLGHRDYTTVNVNPFRNNLILGAEPGEKVIHLGSDRYTLAEAQGRMPGIYRDNIEADPQFVNAAAGDFRLKPTSPCRDAGGDLARTTAAGTGTDVPVDDPMFFCDGFGVIDGDKIVIGANPPVRIVKVDYKRKVLTIDKPLTWAAGDPVNVPYEGKGPDIGPPPRKVAVPMP